MRPYVLKPWKPWQPPKRVKVRCLGPVEREHWFLSDNPLSHRVCSVCAERLASMSARAFDSPVRLERM